MIEGPKGQKGPKGRKGERRRPGGMGLGRRDSVLDGNVRVHRRSFRVLAEAGGEEAVSELPRGSSEVFGENSLPGLPGSELSSLTYHDLGTFRFRARIGLFGPIWVN